MRDRIKLLAEQAGCGWWDGRASRDMTQCQTELEKFAELIVQECMSMCKTSVGNADYNTGRLHCLENIKEHFGVKE